MTGYEVRPAEVAGFRPTSRRRNRMANGDKVEIWWDTAESIVRARAVGVVDEEAAEGIRQETARMAEVHGHGLDWLIDNQREDYFGQQVTGKG